MTICVSLPAVCLTREQFVWRLLYGILGQWIHEAFPEVNFSVSKKEITKTCNFGRDESIISFPGVWHKRV